MENQTEKTTAKKTAQAKPKFPREVKIVNDTAIDYVVTGKFSPKRSETRVEVKDEDQITRMKTDCSHIVALLDNYKEAKKAPLRIEEAE